MGVQHDDGRITAGELTTVCAHYNLGTVRHVSRLKAGSRSAPKVVLVSDRGTFLLKRRAPGHASDPRTVALTHEVILHLEGAGLPAPELVGTVSGNNSMLQLGGRVYEVYRFIQGRTYDRSIDDADAAGALLARLHRALADLRTGWTAPRGCYHDQPSVAPGLRGLADRLAPLTLSAHASDLRSLCESLASRYQRASRTATESGVGSHDVQLIHSDWHPGNVLFRDQPSAGGTQPPPPSAGVRGSRSAAAVSNDPALRIAAILDFDSVRIAPRLADLVNGAMQFALGRSPATGTNGRAGLITGHPEPSSSTREWRIGIDQALLGAFYRGYRREHGLPLTPEEARAAPELMIEALIVEAAAPIAATGRFGKLDPAPILAKVDLATGQIARAAGDLVSIITSP